MNDIKIRIKDLGILCLLMIPCLTFILEEMINNYTVTVFVMAVLAVIPVVLNLRLKKAHFQYSFIWVFYIAAVLLSLLQRDFSQLAMPDAGIIILVVLNIIFMQDKVVNFKFGLKLLCGFGLLNAFFVFVQQLLGSAFNNSYWRFLTPSWSAYAERYYNRGYFMGIQAVPGDAAGLIMFALGMIFCYLFITQLLKQNKDMTKMVLMLVIIGILLVALLFTGKKGVLISGIFAVIAIIVVLMAQKKQWIGILILAGVLVVAYIALRSYIVSHTEVAAFSRLNEFFNNLAEGTDSEITTGRTQLYGYAIDLWSTHKWFGIGWRKFREYTVTMFGYERPHDVNLDYLQFLCECGVVGAVLILIPVIITLVRAVLLARNIMKSESVRGEKWAVLSACFIQFFILFYAFLEIPFFDRVFFVTYAFSCIIINNAYRTMKSENFLPRRRIRFSFK